MLTRLMFVAAPLLMWLPTAVAQQVTPPVPAEVNANKASTEGDALDGLWQCQFETPFGIQTYRLTIASRKEKPSVKAVIEVGDETREIEFVDVKCDGESITFTESRRIDDRDMRIEFNGQVSGQSLMLTRSFGNDLVQRATATRSPSLSSSSQNTEPVVEVKIDRVLKDAYQNTFLIGMAGDLPARYSATELAIANQHFGAITPENCMKPERIHPSEGQWQFERADALVEWAESNEMSVHGHTLVWHQQTPNWFFEGGDKALVTQRLKEHIQTLVGRYRGRLQSWDVVNEAINDGGTLGSDTENLRSSKWMQTLGPDYLTLAFKFAHEADPDAVLYYNDYNIESGAKHASSMALLKRLLDQGAPIHGVGIQGHWRTGQVPYEDIEQAISHYASLGLKVSITELDITIRGAAGGQFGNGFGRGRAAMTTPVTAADLNEQAQAYAKLFAILNKHHQVIERVTFWGLHDRRTWRWGQHPLLFDANLHPKPAYTAIVSEAKP